MPKQTIVLGAGVTGLTTAITLLRNGYQSIIVVGQYLPGDISSHYASPWAGASILTTAQSNNHRLQEIESDTRKEFEFIATHVPEAHVMRCQGTFYTKQPACQDMKWISQQYRNVTEIPKDKLILGAIFGYTFETYMVHVPKYLAWLVKTLKELGGRLERRAFQSIQHVMDHYKEANIIINCTALGSYFLKDIRDHGMYPIRGQTVLVHAPHIKTYHHLDGIGLWTYIIPRDDGTVICGGTAETDNTQTSPDDIITHDILKRACQLSPDLAFGKGPEHVKVLSVHVGFRPARRDGIRLEREIRRRLDGEKVIVCHNYGHGSGGYQSSWGSAQRVLQLIEKDTLSKL